ncbi:MAG: hypothetical protein COB66_04610 [Coxiella sp. (in: Bacteria)]|nr:MAG: hypothetical protein COB66_04610 [Coxiella sp. (in: g-proteobacteria)]
MGKNSTTTKVLTGAVYVTGGLAGWALGTALFSGLGALEGSLGAMVLSTYHAGYDEKISTEAGALGGAAFGAALSPFILCCVFSVMSSRSSNKKTEDKSEAAATGSIVGTAVTSVLLGIAGSSMQRNHGLRRLTIGKQAAASAVGGPLALFTILAAAIGLAIIGGATYFVFQCIQQKRKKTPAIQSQGTQDLVTRFRDIQAREQQEANSTDIVDATIIDIPEDDADGLTQSDETKETPMGAVEISSITEIESSIRQAEVGGRRSPALLFTTSNTEAENDSTLEAANGATSTV